MIICSIIDLNSNNSYNLHMIEFNKKGFNHSKELQFKFKLEANNDLQWEHREIKKYFKSFDVGRVEILCNDYSLLNLLTNENYIKLCV